MPREQRRCRLAVLSWVSFVVLLVVAALDATMFVRWAGQTPGSTDGVGEMTAERHFPVPIVLGHGVIAVGTAVLVILVALGIWGS